MSNIRFHLLEREQTTAVVTAAPAAAFTAETATTTKTATATTRNHKDKASETTPPKCVHIQHERDIFVTYAVRKFEALTSELVINLSFVWV